MKLNIHTVLALFYIFILFNSNILALKEKKFKRYSRRARNIQNNDCETIRKKSKSFNWIAFFYETIQTASRSFLMDLVKTIKNVTNSNKLSDDCISTLTEGLEAKEKEVIQQDNLSAKIDEHSKNLDVKIKKLGLTAEETKMLEDAKDNPRKLCELRVEIVDRQLTTFTEYTKSAKNVINSIEDLKKDENSSLDNLEKKIKETKPENAADTYLYSLLKDKHQNDKSLTREQWVASLEEAKSLFQESQSSSEKVNEGEDSELPNCAKLPTTQKELDRCLNIDFATKTVAFWREINDKNDKKVQDCIQSIAPGGFADLMAKNAAEMLISTVTDVFGLFVVKIAKIVYYGIKLLYYLYKVYKAKDGTQRAKFLGKAAGVSIRIVLALLVRKKLKKHKRKLFK